MQLDHLRSSPGSCLLWQAAFLRCHSLVIFWFTGAVNNNNNYQPTPTYTPSPPPYCQTPQVMHSDESYLKLIALHPELLLDLISLHCPFSARSLRVLRLLSEVGGILISRRTS
jgi:hypothetical protein